MPTRKVAKKKARSTRKETPKNESTGTVAPTIQNEAEYELFCEFMALPSVVRSEIFKHPKTQEGLESQRDFADAYGLHEQRLSEWKRSEDYHVKVSKIRRQYFKGEIGDAIYAVLINTVKEGRGADLKVLLEYTKEIERDDPTGEVGEQLAGILKKLNVMIPG